MQADSTDKSPGGGRTSPQPKVEVARRAGRCAQWPAQAGLAAIAACGRDYRGGGGDLVGEVVVGAAHSQHESHESPRVTPVPQPINRQRPVVACSGLPRAVVQRAAEPRPGQVDSVQGYIPPKQRWTCDATMAALTDPWTPALDTRRGIRSQAPSCTSQFSPLTSDALPIRHGQHVSGAKNKRASATNSEIAARRRKACPHATPLRLRHFGSWKKPTSQPQKPAFPRSPAPAVRPEL